MQHLIDRKKLAFCRDQMGATPLHKAVVYAQKDIINYLLERYGTTIHARDHVRLYNKLFKFQTFFFFFFINILKKT